MKPNDSGTEERPTEVWSELARHAHHGFQLALTVGVFLWVGWWLDGWVGTTPLLTIVGALVGAAGGFYSMYVQLVVEPSERAGGSPPHDTEKAD